MPFNKPQKPNYSIFMLIAFIFFYKFISSIMHTDIQNHIDSVYILTAWNDQILFLPLQIYKGSLLSLKDIKLFIIFIKTHNINPQIHRNVHFPTILGLNELLYLGLQGRDGLEQYLLL